MLGNNRARAAFLGKLLMQEFGSTQGLCKCNILSIKYLRILPRRCEPLIEQAFFLRFLPSGLLYLFGIGTARA